MGNISLYVYLLIYIHVLLKLKYFFPHTNGSSCPSHFEDPCSKHCTLSFALVHSCCGTVASIYCVHKLQLLVVFCLYCKSLNSLGIYQLMHPPPCDTTDDFCWLLKLHVSCYLLACNLCSQAACFAYMKPHRMKLPTVCLHLHVEIPVYVHSVKRFVVKSPSRKLLSVADLTNL